MKLGIMGGSFDPIHMGHLLIAEEARVQLGMEEVVFIPTGQPWMRECGPISPPHHRVNMVRLALACNPFFRLSDVEIERPGPTYTVDTLEEMKRQGSSEEDLYFILGTDSLKEFHRWKQPARILELCTLVTAPRQGCQEVDLSFLTSIDAGASRKVVLLKGPGVDVSGTEIRRRLGRGISVRYQVPETVERYIHRYGLYRDGEVGQ